MLRYITSPESIRMYIVAFLMCLPALLLSLSLHESAHGFVARKCGDDTAYNMGRITLNPLKHLDIIGFVCMILVGFGWAKPVPVNSRNFRNHKRGMILTSIAGPISNLLLGFLFAVIFRFTCVPLAEAASSAQTEQQYFLIMCVIQMIYIAIDLNITLAVFNLLPIPPLDGSKILFSLLPYKVYYKIMPYERYISIAFSVLLLLGVLSPVLTLVSNFIMNFFFLILVFPVM